MNGKFGIITMQILIFLKKTINYYPCERSLAGKDVNEKSMYLLKKLKIFFRTLFYTKQLFVITEIFRGSVTKLKS